MADNTLGNSVTRTIRVTGMSCSGCEQTIRQGLGALGGVLAVRPDHRAGHVTVTYDPPTIRFRTVEETLIRLGYPPVGDLWTRIERYWIHFTEQNKRDNLSYRGHCCNRPPPGR